MFSFGKSAPEFFLISLFLLTLTGKVTGHERIPERVKLVTAMEEHDVILPCSLSTKENIESKLFDWKKDGQKDDKKEVFMYNNGTHYNNGPSDQQDRQFKGRVSHFQDELQHGNASIIIRKTTCSDSGNYTCIFPRLQPSQTFHIELIVDCVLKRRNTPGAAPEPSVTILGETNDWSLLQCEVLGAFPKPKVEWKDSSGNIVLAEEPKITERGGRFDIILNATVTKTDHYHCVATQKEIHHQIDSKIFVHINGTPTGRIVAAVLGILLLLLLVLVVGGACYVKSAYDITPKKRCWGHENDSEKSSVCDHEQGNGLNTKPLLPGSDVPAQTSPV